VRRCCAQLRQIGMGRVSSIKRTAPLWCAAAQLHAAGASPTKQLPHVQSPKDSPQQAAVAAKRRAGRLSHMTVAAAPAGFGEGHESSAAACLHHRALHQAAKADMAADESGDDSDAGPARSDQARSCAAQPAASPEALRDRGAQLCVAQLPGLSSPVARPCVDNNDEAAKLASCPPNTLAAQAPQQLLQSQSTQQRSSPHQQQQQQQLQPSPRGGAPR
jgi:hypothetical protein